MTTQTLGDVLHAGALFTLPACVCWNSFDAYDDDGTPHTGDDCLCYCHGHMPYLNNDIFESVFDNRERAQAFAGELAEHDMQGNAWVVLADSQSGYAFVVTGDHADELMDNADGARYTIMHTAPACRPQPRGEFTTFNQDDWPYNPY